MQSSATPSSWRGKLPSFISHFIYTSSSPRFLPVCILIVRNSLSNHNFWRKRQPQMGMNFWCEIFITRTLAHALMAGFRTIGECVGVIEQCPGWDITAKTRWKVGGFGSNFHQGNQSCTWDFVIVFLGEKVEIFLFFCLHRKISCQTEFSTRIRLQLMQ